MFDAFWCFVRFYSLASPVKQPCESWVPNSFDIVTDIVDHILLLHMVSVVYCFLLHHDFIVCYDLLDTSMQIQDAHLDNL